jgi:hypothetical protein
MLWLKLLLADLSLHRTGLDTRSFHVGLELVKLALGQAFLRALRCPPVSILPPVLHIELQHKSVIIQNIILLSLSWCGDRDISVTTATRYGLEGPGIESR